MTTRTVHGCTGLLVAAVVLAGCVDTRPPQIQEQLLQRRVAVDQRRVTDSHAMFQQLVGRVKVGYDAYNAGRAPAPPQIDIRIISGGTLTGVGTSDSGDSSDPSRAVLWTVSVLFSACSGGASLLDCGRNQSSALSTISSVIVHLE